MPELHLKIDTTKQSLYVIDNNVVLQRYSISTALNGVGQQSGSGCTPLGKHRIRLKVGNACPQNVVFVGRRPTGEIYNATLAKQHPQRDWILTRILWLTGMESGHNRSGHCDSLRRFIYIHGCPDTEPMGIPQSHGCIRMRNADVIELFDQVSNGNEVNIV